MRADHYLPLAMRLLKSTAVLGAICWAVGALLTYAGARSFALAAGYGEARAWLFPLTLDAVALVAYLALLMLPPGSRAYPLGVVALTAGASAAAQGYHQAAVDLALPPWVLFLAGAWPAVAALVAGHLFWMILSRAIPTGLVVALRSLAEVDEQAVAAERTAVSRPVSRPVSRVHPGVDRTRDTAELEYVTRSADQVSDASATALRDASRSAGETGRHDPSRAAEPDASPAGEHDASTAAERNASHAGEPLHVVPPVEPEPRAVGEPVPVPAEVLDAVRAGTITQAEAARRAGVSVKTIRRRLGAAAVA